MAIKKINTTVTTGGSFTVNGETYIIGLLRRVNGKSLIDVKKRISETSCITMQMSTRQLNKFLTLKD